MTTTVISNTTELRHCRYCGEFTSHAVLLTEPRDTILWCRRCGRVHLIAPAAMATLERDDK